jgi:hypothetical protein
MQKARETSEDGTADALGKLLCQGEGVAEVIQRDRDRERQTERQKETDRQRQRYCRERYTHSNSEDGTADALGKLLCQGEGVAEHMYRRERGNTERQRKRYRETDRETERDREIETNRDIHTVPVKMAQY